MAKALAVDSMAHVQGGYNAAHHRKPVASAGFITNFWYIPTLASLLARGPCNAKVFRQSCRLGYSECQLLPLLFDGESIF